MIVLSDDMFSLTLHIISNHKTHLLCQRFRFVAMRCQNLQLENSLLWLHLLRSVV